MIKLSDLIISNFLLFILAVLSRRMRLMLVLLVLCLIAVNIVEAVTHDEKMKKLAASLFGNKHENNKYKKENLKDFNKQAVQITAFGVILEQCEEE